MKKKLRLKTFTVHRIKTLNKWKSKFKKLLIMKINRGPGCLSFRKSCSKQLKELNSYREELEALVLRLDKDLMVQQPGDNMDLELDQETMHMEAMDQEILAEDQPRNLVSRLRIIDLYQII
jgi:hypothetical protein